MGRSLPPMNALRAFEIASRTSSFTAAGGDLCITQGAVSRHIARLEEHLGVSLFERKHRQVHLTELGAVFAEELHHAFDRIEEATRSVSRARNRQRIRLGLFPTIATGWLMRRLTGFQAAYPGIELQVTCKTDFVDGDRHRFDIMSARGPVAEPASEYQPIVDIVLRPLCSPALLSGPHGLRSPADLRHCNTLHSINRRGDWDAWLAHAGIGQLDASRVLLFENSVLAHHAAAAGVGVAMGICRLNHDDKVSGRLVEPFPLALRTGQSYGLAWSKSMARLPAIGAFRDWLRAEIAEQSAGAPATDA
jgi:LysR family glycine cleavage system transcriptional activator